MHIIRATDSDQRGHEPQGSCASETHEHGKRPKTRFRTFPNICLSNTHTHTETGRNDEYWAVIPALRSLHTGTKASPWSPSSLTCHVERTPRYSAGTWMETSISIATSHHGMISPRIRRNGCWMTSHAAHLIRVTVSLSLSLSLMNTHANSTLRTCNTHTLTHTHTPTAFPVMTPVSPSLSLSHEIHS